MSLDIRLRYAFRVWMVCTSSSAIKRLYPLTSALRIALSFLVTFKSLVMLRSPFSGLWFNEDDTVEIGFDYDYSYIQDGWDWVKWESGWKE